jgi:hypothetical protein
VTSHARARGLHQARLATVVLAIAVVTGCGNKDSSGRPEEATADESASPGEGVEAITIDSLKDLGPLLGCEVHIVIDASAAGGESVGDIIDDPSPSEVAGLGFSPAYFNLQEHTSQVGRCGMSYALRSLDDEISRTEILDGIAASCQRAQQSFPDLDEVVQIYAFGELVRPDGGWWLVQPNSFEDPETLEPLASYNVERGQYDCPQGAIPDRTTTSSVAEGSAISGTLYYEDSDERVPVEGAVVSVISIDGSHEGTTESDDDGSFELSLPGPGDYEVILDEESLPENVYVRNSAQITVTLQDGQNLTVLFALVSA